MCNCGCNQFYNNRCSFCGKPISAEKKECEPEFMPFSMPCEYNQDVEDCVKGTFMDKPEPKPKDRIEEIRYGNVALGNKDISNYGELVWNVRNCMLKINELIQRINERER